MASFSTSGNSPNVDQLYYNERVIATDVYITYSLIIKGSEPKYILYWETFFCWRRHFFS